MVILVVNYRRSVIIAELWRPLGKTLKVFEKLLFWKKRFTFDRVKAKCVNSAKTRRKVNPLFG